jgi:hypothetical protein
MKDFTRELIFGTILLVIFTGIIIWVIFSGSQSFLPIGIAILIVLIGTVTFITQTIKKKKDIESGAPPEDEFTKLAKVYAGNQAFLYSQYLWLLIFVFNSSFSKNETMLGIGILGSGLIYGITLWYFRSTGEFNA